MFRAASVLLSSENKISQKEKEKNDVSSFEKSLKTSEYLTL